MYNKETTSVHVIVSDYFCISASARKPSYDFSEDSLIWTYFTKKNRCTRSLFSGPLVVFVPSSWLLWLKYMAAIRELLFGLCSVLRTSKEWNLRGCNTGTNVMWPGNKYKWTLFLVLACQHTALEQWTNYAKFNIYVLANNVGHPYAYYVFKCIP